MAVDFEAEGLLEGIEDPDARRARLELLERLSADGVPLGELRRAAAEDRLALLPVERILQPPTGARYSAREVAAESGIEVDFLDRLWRALGLPLLDREDRVYSEGDLEAARTVKGFLDAGFAPDAVIEITRVIGTSMATVVTAVNDLVRETMVRPGDTELDVALRLSDAARVLAPQLEPLLGYVAGVHRLEQNRQAVVSAAELAGGLRGTRWTVACFADLVGFTRLGERLPPEELGAVAGRLGDIAAEVVEPPVALVKTIGDAVMLVSPDADAALDAALTLLERSEAEGEQFPELRAGLAAGEALRRSGDWYGRAVNLASRVTSQARRGSVLATGAVREAAKGEFAWSKAGIRHLRGVSGDVPLFRVRRQTAD